MMAMSFSMAVIRPLTTEPSAECSAENDSSSRLAKSSRVGFAWDICAPEMPGPGIVRRGLLGRRRGFALRSGPCRIAIRFRRIGLPLAAAIPALDDAAGRFEGRCEKSRRRPLSSPSGMKRARRLLLSAFVPGGQSLIDQPSSRLERGLYIHFARVEQVRVG